MLLRNECSKRDYIRIRVGVILAVIFTSLLGGCKAKVSEPTTVGAQIVEVANGQCDQLLTQALDREIYRSGLVSSEQDTALALTGASTYAIQVDISEELDLLQGCEMVRYTNREDGELSEVYLLLFPNLAGGTVEVSAVSLGDTLLTTKLEGDAALRVDLPQALSPGDSIDLYIEFVVALPVNPGGNYALFGLSDNVLMLSNFYPTIPVYDDEGWNITLPPPYGDVTYLDASFYLVQVSAPAGMTLAGSGVEVAQSSGGNQQTITYAAGPIRDFYLAANEKGKAYLTQTGEVSVRVFAESKYKEAAKRIGEYAAKAIEVFSERFNAYPYTELDFFLAPFEAYGMEYPGAILLTTNMVSEGGTIEPQLEMILESVVAHEVAHQWFFNQVGSDSIDEPWLDEALAQYSSYLYYLDEDGSAAAMSYRSSWTDRWERVDKEEIPIGWATEDYTFLQYGAIVYGRGPFFLEVLSEEMGEATFDDFLRDYATENHWGIATASSFQQLAEEHCNCDLEELFTAWVDAPE